MAVEHGAVHPLGPAPFEGQAGAWVYDGQPLTLEERFDRRAIRWLPARTFAVVLNETVNGVFRRAITLRVVVVPRWAPLACSLGMAWLLRRRKPRAGSCENCGYDLRATPDRCPECGAASGSPEVRG